MGCSCPGLSHQLLTPFWKLPGFESGSAWSTLSGGGPRQGHPQRPPDELPSIPAEDVAVSLEQKVAQWMNVLDQRVMETEEKVRRHSRKAPFRYGPVADAHTHAHTMFCKIFKGILETLRGGARGAAEPHSSAPGQDKPLGGAQSWDRARDATTGPTIYLLKHISNMFTHPGWTLVHYSSVTSLRIN